MKLFLVIDRDNFAEMGSFRRKADAKAKRNALTLEWLQGWPGLKSENSPYRIKRGPDHWRGATA